METYIRQNSCKSLKKLAHSLTQSSILTGVAGCSTVEELIFRRAFQSCLQLGSGARSIASVSSPTLLAIVSDDFLLAGVGSRSDVAHPDFAVDKLEQWPHVRWTRCNDTHSGLDARPHTGVNLGI